MSDVINKVTAETKEAISDAITHVGDLARKSVGTTRSHPRRSQSTSTNPHARAPTRGAAAGRSSRRRVRRVLSLRCDD